MCRLVVYVRLVGLWACGQTGLRVLAAMLNSLSGHLPLGPVCPDDTLLGEVDGSTTTYVFEECYNRIFDRE